MAEKESLDLEKKLIHIMETRMKYSVKQQLLRALGDEYGLSIEEIRNEQLRISKK